MLENGDVTDRGKKEKTRPDFDGITAKNVVDGGLAIEHCLADFHKPLTKYRMLDVGFGFFTSIDTIIL